MISIDCIVSGVCARTFFEVESQPRQIDSPRALDDYSGTKLGLSCETCLALGSESQLHRQARLHSLRPVDLARFFFRGELVGVWAVVPQPVVGTPVVRDRNAHPVDYHLRPFAKQRHDRSRTSGRRPLFRSFSIDNPTNKTLCRINALATDRHTRTRLVRFPERT